MTLSQEDIVRGLMGERIRISASIYLVVRDAHVAEDIFQNVTVKALAGKATFEHEAQLYSWARITARHEGLNWLRDNRARTTVLDSAVLDLLEAAPASTPSHAHIDHLEALRTCMEKVPEQARKMLELRYVDEQPCTEVSRTMKLELDTVYQRLSRLHRSLRICISRQLGEELPPREPARA
jgi:RNA polymerase sigma-70 factor, ECF subfamily